MKAIKLLYFVIGCLLVASCSSELPPNEFITWVKNVENGLHKQKTIAPYTFDVQCKPTAFKVLNEEGMAFSKVAFQKRMAEEKGMVYFDLRLGVANSNLDLLKFESEGLPDYQKRLYYFSFQFQNDIYLEQNGKKIPCSIFHFERAFSLKGNRSFLLGFDAKTVDKPVTLVIDSKMLGTGITKIKFDLSQNLPAIRWAS